MKVYLEWTAREQTVRAPKALQRAAAWPRDCGLRRQSVLGQAIPRFGHRPPTRTRAARPNARTLAPPRERVLMGVTRGRRIDDIRTLGELNALPAELAEHALAHVISDKAEQAYRRSGAPAPETATTIYNLGGEAPSLFRVRLAPTLTCYPAAPMCACLGRHHAWLRSRQPLIDWALTSLKYTSRMLLDGSRAQDSTSPVCLAFQWNRDHERRHWN
jgi:hypothetical protein